MMTAIWIFAACVLAVLWVISIVDIVRHHYPTGTAIGWIVLVVLLPFIGSAIYWAMRKPTTEDAENQYLGEAELRRARADRPFDRTGMGP